MSVISGPRIYNLFPRLAGHLGGWLAHAERARAMSFDWIFINPIQYPGFSGSLYAIKDFYRLNPLFAPPDAADPLQELRRTLAAIHDLGLRVMLDLVVNHAAKDSPLIKDHPSWFRRDAEGYVVSPSAIDPADARKVTVWGDLAEVDNAKSADRAELWAYWTAMLQYHLDLGFDGFRCDAAYKVPAGLWQQLIRAGRALRPDAVFLAETLGCRLAEARALRDCGFDYLCNSSKWWCFDAPWCLEQHAEFGEVAPSVGFPESHDTERLMVESGGLVAVQRQRYAFAAAFSSGVLMPIGYEHCFTRRLDVVATLPEHWEDTGHDISPFISRVNELKASEPLLGCEGSWDVVTTLDAATTVLRKRHGAQSDAPPLVLLINKDWRQPQTLRLPDLKSLYPAPPRVLRVCRERWRAEKLPRTSIALDPAEVVYVLPAG